MIVTMIQVIYRWVRPYCSIECRLSMNLIESECRCQEQIRKKSFAPILAEEYIPKGEAILAQERKYLPKSALHWFVFILFYFSIY